ncbi:MAG: GMC oxidoreductase, partial [Chloroflexota bacterium]|nr:GMC oxidoreductase [Chloroflexota bacterium]
HALEVIGATLLPGAAEAGIVHHVNAQLATDDPFLIYRYLDLPIPPVDFYRAALSALDAFDREEYGAVFASLPAGGRITIVAALTGGVLAGWAGPPPALVYDVLRMDADDVVYGTEAGFARLDLPSHRFHPDDERALGEGMPHGEGGDAGGAREVWLGALTSQHIMGGAIIGTDPATSVTDGFGRTHDVPNLVIAGIEISRTLFQRRTEAKSLRPTHQQRVPPGRRGLARLCDPVGDIEG